MKEFSKALLLGLPVNTTSGVHLEEHLATLIDNFHEDLQPRFGTTVNALVLGLACGWPFLPRDPEVLKHLRNADFVGLDSPFLSRLALLLGTKIPQISSDDLLAQAVSYASKNGKKIYLIGGDEKICKETSKALQQDYPGLKICGYSAPQIYTKGLHLEHSIEEDPQTIAAIQAANPDLLLIQLGHPKQDLWFGRICNQMKIPLSLGVGGAFERYLSSKGKALTENSGWSLSSFKRKAIALTRFALWSPLLFLYNTVNRLLYDLFYKHFSKGIPTPKLFLSQNDALFVVPFPTLLDSSNASKWSEKIDAAFEHDHIVLDLRQVRHITLKGLGMLHSIKKRAERNSKNLFILGLSADLCWFLKIHGAWDLFAPLVCTDPTVVLDRLAIKNGNSGDHDFVGIEQTEERTTISVFGTLNGWEDDKHGLMNVSQLIDGKDCVMDLTQCSGITNRGFGFLLKLRSRQSAQISKLTLFGVSRRLKGQFKLAKLFRYFDFQH
jgi:exopolysaccharide biosynthesis WecB/TagA/CpsF family protein/anti-anti-sigma factor